MPDRSSVRRESRDRRPYRCQAVLPCRCKSSYSLREAGRQPVIASLYQLICINAVQPSSGEYNDLSAVTPKPTARGGGVRPLNCPGGWARSAARGLPGLFRCRPFATTGPRSGSATQLQVGNGVSEMSIAVGERANSSEHRGHEEAGSRPTVTRSSGLPAPGSNRGCSRPPTAW